MKFQISTAGMQEFTDMLLRMSDPSVFAGAVTEALTTAGEIAVQRLQEAADQYHGGHSGRMRDSITASRPTINEYGGYLTVQLKGVVSGKWRYRDQGAELNFGSDRRKHPSGWFDKGQEKAQPEVEQAMVNVLEAWISSIDGVA